MKKLLITIIALLMVSLLPLTNANARVTGTLGEEDADYYAIESSKAILDLQFNGSGAWGGTKNGLYSEVTTEEDGKLVYSGVASWTRYMTITPNDQYKNAVLVVDVVAELVGVREFYACALQDYNDTHSYPSILRESGIQNIQYDENGNVLSWDKRVGWLGGSDDCTKDVFNVTEEGYLHMQFVVCTNEKGIAEIGFEVVGYDTNNATIKVDSLTVSKAEYKAVYDLDFEGSGTWGDKDGLYAPDTYEEAGALVYTGAASWTKFLTIKPNDQFKNAILSVDLVFELVGVKEVYATARQGYGSNSYPDILREAGVQFVEYIESGSVKSFGKRVGWLGGSDDNNRDVFTITPEGYLKMHSIVFTGEQGIVEIGVEVVGYDTTNATVKVHSLSVSTCEVPSSSARYYTYAWNTSMEDLDTNAQPWDNQPIWANSMSWETENPLDGTHSIKVSGSATNDPVWGIQIGGFDTTTENKKLLKQAGLHYIQMDVDSADFEWFNIWTTGADYYAIKFHIENGWSTEGKVQNFQVKDLGNCYRISYYVDYVNPSTEHNINVFNGSGSIYFDNLVVAYVDNSPSVQSGLTYNMINKEDVVAKVALKGAKNPVLLGADGNAVDASLYTLTNDTLTLSKDLFTDADSYQFTLSTSNGNKAFTVSKNDDRTVLTAVTLTGVSKVYDGTTTVDMTNVVITLEGLLEGADVKATVVVEYSSANAGSNIVLVVSSLELTGTDAYKYLLPETVTLTGEITPKTVTVVADNKTKVEGEADPELTYTVTGLLEGDSLTGALSRTEGETAGKYEITLGTLKASSNYTVEFTKAELEITAKEEPTPEGPTQNPGDDQPTDTPSGNEPTEKPTPSTSGCGGSVIASILGLFALAGATIVLRKKREE